MQKKMKTERTSRRLKKLITIGNIQCNLQDAKTNIKLQFINDSETSDVKQTLKFKSSKMYKSLKQMLISMFKKFDLFKPTIWF